MGESRWSGASSPMGSRPSVQPAPGSSERPQLPLCRCWLEQNSSTAAEVPSWAEATPMCPYSHSISQGWSVPLSPLGLDREEEGSRKGSRGPDFPLQPHSLLALCVSLCLPPQTESSSRGGPMSGSSVRPHHHPAWALSQRRCQVTVC